MSISDSEEADLKVLSFNNYVAKKAMYADPEHSGIDEGAFNLKFARLVMEGVLGNGQRIKIETDSMATCVIQNEVTLH